MNCRFLETFIWFCIVLFHVFPLFNCSKILCIFVLLLLLLFISCWTFIIKVSLYVICFLNIFYLHSEKHRNFTWFPDVEIFSKRHSFRLGGNCAFPQNFRTRKSGEITIFFAVLFIVFIIFIENIYLEVLWIGLEVFSCNKYVDDSVICQRYSRKSNFGVIGR